VIAWRTGRRFRVESIELDSQGVIDPGNGVHGHLRALRAAAGDVVFLFDGRGGEVEAEITAIDDDGATLRVISEVQAGRESDLDSCLVQAIPARSGRMETIVRQVTELGVCRIVPVIAQRSQQSKGEPAALERKADRWRRIADAAAEQSHRTRVPVIDRPCRFDGLAWETLPRPLFIMEPGAGGTVVGPGQGAAAVFDAASVPAAATVMVGPEGGWTVAEVDGVTSRGGSILQLGSRVLRADTAGVVAITLFQYLWGDLRR
jgi:16S rRNA (uracil1498-N3)-methyltransferase